LERVRAGADFMPFVQVDMQMKRELGNDWRTRFKEFSEKPFAAASIGQVHRAVALDGQRLAIKIQYPGVASGIDADIDNLISILNLGGLLPKGMFLQEFVAVSSLIYSSTCFLGCET
jgi:aarF domain-containing kinase